MADARCMLCGRIIPEGRHICLSCEAQNEMQTFERKQQPITNGDRIRSMTDEQLIPVLHHYVCIQFPTGCPYEHCDDCVRAWLRREARDEL